MGEHYYQRRLKRDLDKWVTQGKISKENADDIFNDLPSSGMMERLPSIIAILGAVLICFGILAFVAANWYGVPKAARLALVAAGMWVAYGCAGVLHRRGALWLFEAVILIGVGIYASGIVLIAQMYHIDGHYPDAVFMIGAGALVAAWLVRSTGALIIAIAAITLWTSLEIIQFDVEFHWPFLIAWGVLTLVAFGLKSRTGYHLVTLSFGYWAIMTLLSAYGLSVSGAVSVLASIAFMVLTISLVVLHHRQKQFSDSFASPLSHYAMITLVVAIFLVQVMEAGSIDLIFAKFVKPLFQDLSMVSSFVLAGSGILLSVFWRKKIGYSAVELCGLVLIGLTVPVFSIIGVDNLITSIPLAIVLFLISLWLIALGQKLVDRTFINLGFALFAAETLYIYFKTFGTLMNSFVFFTIGGVILISLALGLDRFRKRIFTAPIVSGSEQ